jgi:hypothetical protein
MLQAAKVLERMCNQNTFDEIAQGKIAQGSEYFPRRKRRDKLVDIL